jgi:hypothetical protein
LKRGKEQGGPVVKRAIKDPQLSLPASVCRREKGGWWRRHRIKTFKEAHTSKMMAVPKLSTQLTKAGFYLPH